VAVEDQLARFVSRVGKPQSVDGAVQSSLQKREKNLAGDALLPICLFKGIAKLIFQYAIDSFDLLFFTKLGSILGKLFSTLTVLSRRIAPPFNGALFRIAPLAFEKKFKIFSSA
jgi:hypothetical protein